MRLLYDSSFFPGRSVRHCRAISVHPALYQIPGWWVFPSLACVGGRNAVSHELPPVACFSGSRPDLSSQLQDPGPSCADPRGLSSQWLRHMLFGPFIREPKALKQVSQSLFPTKPGKTSGDFARGKSRDIACRRSWGALSCSGGSITISCAAKSRTVCYWSVSLKFLFSKVLKCHRYNNLLRYAGTALQSCDILHYKIFLEAKELFIISSL